MINVSEGSRWTASFVPFYHSMSLWNNAPQCSGEWKTRNLCLSPQSLSFYPPFVSVCACAYTRCGCSISSGFSPYYPLKWAQNRILSCHYARDWLCWQQTFFMQNTQKQSTVQQERSRQISLAMKTARVRTVFPSFSKEISRSKFRMCCGTNARSLLCHLNFNK